MVATYSLTASTAQPSTSAVELRCPGLYVQAGGNRRCGRLLARAVPVGQTQQKCPRCGTFTTFTFSTGVLETDSNTRSIVLERGST